MLLEKYSNICSAAGDEKDIRDTIRKDIENLVDEVRINPLGNLIAIRVGKEQNRALLVTAHMDEVAFIVKSVEKNGLIKFYPIGGFVAKILCGNSVSVGKKRIPGVIAHRSVHVMTHQELKKVPKEKELFIDVGASSGDEVKDIHPGDYVYFRSRFFAQKNFYFGKAFDDRAGCSVITEVLKEYPMTQKPGITIVATYTVQEEVGLRGSATATYGHKNLLFNLNLEGTTCSDRELKETYSPSTEIGKGPAITFMDRTTITNRTLLKFVVSVAERNSIPYQFKRTVTGGTDAGNIHLSEEGIPSITVSVPVRYIHAPWSIIHSKDYEYYIALAKAIVKEGGSFHPDNRY